MKHLFVYFSLLCMLLLSACGGGETAPSAQPLPSPSAGAAAPPSPASPVASPVPDRDGSPGPGTATPEGTPPSVTPSATPAPTPSAAPAPSEGPSDEPSETVPTAQALYETAYAAGGGAATLDLTDLLGQFYQLTGEELEDYALYLPEISMNIEEYFIARVKPGQMETVKAACQSRLQGLREDAEFYPATGAYVESAQLVTQGDWLFFCVCPDAAGAADAVRAAWG